MSFDAYHQWLGIPPEQQPPDCYQLLGVRRFEQNPTVISNAAERQLLMLKSLQNGPHGALTQQLMNEVSAARVRLLDPDKKAEYDEELRSGGRRKRAVPPPVPITELDAGTVEAPLVNDSASTVLKSTSRTTPLRGRRHSFGRRRPRVVVASLCGAVAVASLALFAVWFSNPRDSDRQTSEEPARVAQGPAAPVQQDQQKITASPIDNSFASDAGETAPPEPTGQDSSGDDITLEAPGVDDTMNSEPTAGDVASRDQVGIASKGSGSDALPATDDNHTGAMPPEEPELAAGNESEAFARLPTQLNLTGTVEATRAGYVFIGDLESTARETWNVRIDDYGASVDRPRFSIGTVAVDESGLHWPVRFNPSGVTDALSGDVNLAHQAVGRLEVEARKLSLWLDNPDDQDTLRALSYCGIVLENKYGRHHVQLSLPASMPPIPLSLEKTKQTILFENAPALASVPLDRWELEVVRVERDAVAIPADTKLQAGYSDEITVSLDSGLSCELGVALIRETDQYGIGLMPRYILNERRLPMVPSKLEREIAQSKSQLIKNQRELVQAQNALQVLPGEIARVRSLPTRSAPEAAMKQSQLSRLSGMLNSAQSRVRRLSKVVPEQNEGLAQRQGVLKFANELTDQVTVHFRLLVRSEYGEYLLLVATEVAPSEPGGTR